MATENIIREIKGKSTKDTFKLTVSSKPELRTMAESLAAVYNDAILDGNFNPVIEVIAEDNKETAMAVREAMEFIVNKYTSIARTECFDALKATDNPMLEAVKQLTYQTIRIVDKPGKKDGEAPKTSIEDSEKPIDLLKLHKYVGGDGIGADKNWAYKVEKLNFLMTAQKAIDLGIDPKAVHDSYAMSEISRDIDLGKTPTSKTNILKTVQAIVTAMVGEEYKATSHDVNFLMSVYSRKNRKALTVTCANHKYMRQYMAEICHRIVLGKSYALDFKAKRQ